MYQLPDNPVGKIIQRLSSWKVVYDTNRFVNLKKGGGEGLMNPVAASKEGRKMNNLVR